MSQSVQSLVYFVLSIFIFVLISYSFFTFIRTLIVILGGFGKPHHSESTKIQNYHPLVSILVPAWNEEVGITKTVDSIMTSTYDNFELILIDDRSKDKTWEYMQKLKETYPDITICSQENAGKASALNHGISLSKGKIIVTIDADSYILSTAITEIVAAMQYENVDAATGRIVIGNTDGFWELAQYYEFVVNFHYKNYQSTRNSIFVITGAFAAYKRNVLLECGEFDGTVKREDLDYSLKMIQKGFYTVNASNAICVTEGPSTFDLFIKQRTRWKWCAYYVFIYRYHSLLFNKSIKSKYFSYIDFPLAVLFALEQLLFPLLWIMSLFIFLLRIDYTNILLFNIVLPALYMFLLVLDLPMKYRIFKGIPVVAILFNAISLVEFIASCKAILLLLKRQSTSWDKITRIGIK